MWTFMPLHEFDMESTVLAKGAIWIAEDGQVWHGVDPDAHYRCYQWRRWQRDEAIRCAYSYLALRRQSLPSGLTNAVLQMAFDCDTIGMLFA